MEVSIPLQNGKISYQIQKSAPFATNDGVQFQKGLIKDTNMSGQKITLFHLV